MKYIYTSHTALDPRITSEDVGFRPANEPFITAEDRSFRFGDGVFETMLIVDGKLYEAPSHFERLKNGLEYFRIPYNISGLEKTCRELIAKNNCESGYLRIIISRGENGPGAVGYLPGPTEPLVVIQTIDRPFPAYSSLKLWVSEHRAHHKLPCKTNSAIFYTLAMLEAKEYGAENALILSTQDEICETASGNLFWLKQGVLYTPVDSLPFVPGTVRKKVIELSPLPVKEGRYMLADLVDAEEIFMTNIGGLVTRVASIAPLGYVAKGDAITAQIRDLIEKDISAKIQAQS